LAKGQPAGPFQQRVCSVAAGGPEEGPA